MTEPIWFEEPYGAPDSPFLVDTAIVRLAQSLGMTFHRVEAVEVTDERAIAAAGLVKQTPDYAAIRKALRGGQLVPGARWKGVEYILRAPDAQISPESNFEQDRRLR